MNPTVVVNNQTVTIAPQVGPQGTKGDKGDTGDNGQDATWVTLTQAEYEALDPPQENTLYLITDA